MEPSEIEQNVNKIKELLKSEDFDVVNTGLELLRSLDEEAVYEKLLEGCGADKEGKLVNEKKEISDYLVCSLASISNGQKAKKIKENLTVLSLYERNISNVDGLANLTNITRLNLHCESLINLDGLGSLTNLTYLDISYCKSTNLNVLVNLTNLHELNIKSELIQNVDFVERLTKLTSFSFGGGENLGNMDAMMNLTNLVYLNLYNTPFNLIWYDKEESEDPDDDEVEYSGLSGDQLSVWFSYMFGDKHERAYKGWIEDVLEDGSNGNVAGFRHQLYRVYYKNLSPHIENEYPEM